MNTWERYPHDELISTLNSIIESRKIIRQQVYENRGFTPAQISELQKESTGGFDFDENIRKLMSRGDFTPETASQALRVSGNDFNRALASLLASKTTSVVQDINKNVGNVNTSIGNVNTSIGDVNTSIGNVNTNIGELELTSRQQQIKDVMDTIMSRYSDVPDMLKIVTQTIPTIQKFNTEQFRKFLDIGRVIKNTVAIKDVTKTTVKNPKSQIWALNTAMEMGPSGTPFIYLNPRTLLLGLGPISFNYKKDNLPIKSTNGITQLSHDDRLDLLRLLVSPTHDQPAVYKTISNQEKVLAVYISITKEATGADPSAGYASTSIAGIFTGPIQDFLAKQTTGSGKGRPTKTAVKALGRQYELLAGTYEAGNKSIFVKRQLKTVINNLHDHNLINSEDHKKELTKYKLNNIKL